MQFLIMGPRVIKKIDTTYGYVVPEFKINSLHVDV